MIFLKQNWFKLLAILFLLGALGNNDYSYYQVLRWAILIVGAYSSYSAYKLGNKYWIWIFGIIAILFNPISIFTFQKDIWQFIDVIVATMFFISLFQKHGREN